MFQEVIKYKNHKVVLICNERNTRFGYTFYYFPICRNNKENFMKHWFVGTALLLKCNSCYNKLITEQLIYKHLLKQKTIITYKQPKSHHRMNSLYSSVTETRFIVS